MLDTTILPSLYVYDLSVMLERHLCVAGRQRAEQAGERGAVRRRQHVRLVQHVLRDVRTAQELAHFFAEVVAIVLQEVVR